MTDGPNQPNVFKAFPVVFRDPPPEGQMVVPLVYNFTNSTFAFNQAPNMSQLGVSQIASVVVDNSQNSQQLIMLLGNTAAPVTVPAYGGGVYPVTSNKGNFLISLAVAVAPTQNFAVNIELCNYRQTATEWGLVGNLPQNYPNYPSNYIQSLFSCPVNVPTIALVNNPKRFSYAVTNPTASTGQIAIGYAQAVYFCQPGQTIEVKNPSFQGQVSLWTINQAAAIICGLTEWSNP